MFKNIYGSELTADSVFRQNNIDETRKWFIGWALSHMKINFFFVEYLMPLPPFPIIFCVGRPNRINMLCDYHIDIIQLLQVCNILVIWSEHHVK